MACVAGRTRRVDPCQTRREADRQRKSRGGSLITADAHPRHRGNGDQSYGPDACDPQSPASGPAIAKLV
jgi:hypothetical protein